MLMKKEIKSSKRITKAINDNRGSTMMETLVAFVVLMIIVAALTRLVMFSSELRMRATDMNRITQEFNKEIYADRSTYIKSDDSDVFVNGASKVVYKKYETTKEKTAHGNESGPLFYLVSPEDGELWVSDINAYGYSYKTDDAVIKDNNLTVPKAIVFVHKNDDK